MKFKNINGDVAGITVSIICAIHCALLPALFISFPVFGINIIENIYYEASMIVLASVIGSWTIIKGYKKRHHKVLPLILFIAGVLFLISKQVWHHFEYWFLFPGIICIIVAHYLNFQWSRKISCT